MVEPALIENVFRFLQLDAGSLDRLPEQLRQALNRAGQSEIIIGVCGGEICTPQIAAAAEEVGQLIAARGATLLTGGRGGVMAAASRGAQKGGGLTVAILPGSDRKEANQFVDIPITTGWGWGRNYLIPLVSDAIIAIDGEYGTLSEVAFALEMKRPVLGLMLTNWSLKDLRVVATPEEAVNAIWERLSQLNTHGFSG